MLKRKFDVWMAIATLSAGLLGGCELSSWTTMFSTAQATKGPEEPALARRLAQLEKAVTALTNSLQSNNTKGSLPKTTCTSSQSNEHNSRQAIAQIIREELQHALLRGNPENQQARAEEIAVAQALHSPENRAAYQSAAAVVHTALVTGRWTDEDGRIFRDAFVQLTNDQRTEVMELLAPAINRGEIVVETSGPLF